MLRPNVSLGGGRNSAIDTRVIISITTVSGHHADETSSIANCTELHIYVLIFITIILYSNSAPTTPKSESGYIVPGLEAWAAHPYLWVTSDAITLFGK